ncbi:conserved hypothetical protein [Sulfurovum sp. enrichment culture clone C5]|uniref:Uracil-DNA glycosylase-like domain-containing protein n=1 Tax=Sulfurovum sp. enrichment culture clone C5 TaxID=497650 RepID=A0A0S4XPQ3_9BACT|nr:conserved hypothetical protein [Sulfurovum sp. enrichment culture clone C5]
MELNREEINKKLQARYEDIWKKLKATQPSAIESLPTPLFLEVPQTYCDAKYKIMIFGQETHEWGNFSEHNLDGLIKQYHEFYENNVSFSKDKSQYNVIFFRAFKKIKKLLDKKFGEENSEVIWNNIVKIGKYEGKNLPSEEIMKWQEPLYESMIKFEVELLKPDIIIFFTGPNYDQYIKKAFGDISYEPIQDYKIVFIQSSNLPKNSIRTYHPGYLNRIGIDTYLKNIVDAIELYNTPMG